MDEAQSICIDFASVEIPISCFAQKDFEKDEVSQNFVPFTFKISAIL